jgi:CBS-domain-containing membrane protein
MVDTVMISDLVSADVNTIEPHETVRSAQRRMESQTLRSLIVVDGDRPVGVIKWRDIRTTDGEALISDHMTRDFPVLISSMGVVDARAHLGDVDFDHIPVVDENGQLVGEVPRGSLVHHETATAGEDRVTADGMPIRGADTGHAANIQADMDVVDAEGHKLGKVTEVSSDPTTHRMSHVIIEHGLLRKKHKRVPVDTVTRFDDDNVVLGITKMEFDFLADIEDQEA